MVRHLSLPAVLLALASSGCGNQLEPCTEGCPDISGVYAVQNATPVGQCPFSPYLLAPTVQLLQSDNGRKATLDVIDPSSNLEVQLTGDVYARGPGEDSELLGSFQLNSSVVRAASQSDGQPRVLDVSATGSVSLREGRRVLSATLSTTDITNGESTGCSISLAITGEGS
ncbi:hypothetical protein [Archangium lipolyticum]|uniref:hypothetical protein n=1 Tax=Archangium lipolyticum TaxID=2970465 RepID=UPI00214A72A9|nr:hypothetical protein [Archangium lipolyticum]